MMLNYKLSTIMNEEKMMEDARRWFEEKYGMTPEECGMRSIKKWVKPLVFVNIPTVVFAESEDICSAFIKEQTWLFRVVRYVIPIFILPLVIAVIISPLFTLVEIFAFLLVYTVIAGLFFFRLGIKCRKLERIHKWNVDVYFPER